MSTEERKIEKDGPNYEISQQMKEIRFPDRRIGSMLRRYGRLMWKAIRDKYTLGDKVTYELDNEGSYLTKEEIDVGKGEVVEEITKWPMGLYKVKIDDIDWILPVTSIEIVTGELAMEEGLAKVNRNKQLKEWEKAREEFPEQLFTEP